MKNFHGAYHNSTALGLVTMKEFEKKYREFTNSPDKLPTASNLIPLRGANGASIVRQETQKDAQGNDMKVATQEALYDAIIFWESNTPPTKSIVAEHRGPDVPQRKKLEID